MIKERGEIVWLGYYRAWGELFSEKLMVGELDNLKVSASDFQPIRFQGQFYDGETGLHYNWFRYYDNDMGMFISRDPIGLMGGNNVFAYAPNPVGWVDPVGLTAICPQRPPRNDVRWKKYYGDPAYFHCNFEGYLENRTPSPDNPMAECFYDNGNLVTASHPFSSCGGTPDQYGEDNKFLHTVWDSGGIVRAGLPAAYDSFRYKMGRILYENVEKPIQNIYRPK